MSTVIARRTPAQIFAAELRRVFASLIAALARRDASIDEASTRFSWPRGL